ncbi:hypothetical protein HID58_012458, partial [Brassica napus]
ERREEEHGFGFVIWFCSLSFSETSPSSSSLSETIFSVPVVPRRNGGTPCLRGSSASLNQSLSSWLLDQPTTDVSLFVPPRVHRRLGNIPLRGSPGRRRTALSLEILESEGSIWSGGGSRQRRGRSLSKALRESLRDQLPFDVFSGKRAWEGSSIRSLDKRIRSM